MKNMHPAKGRCLCGKIHFNISDLNRDVVICHCEQCRKQTGHMVAATRAKDANIDIEGAEHLTWFTASQEAKRGFCKHCGSLLFWKPGDADQTSVMAGSLDSPTGLKTVAHIFTEFKGDYYEITDDVPQFEGGFSGQST